MGFRETEEKVMVLVYVPSPGIPSNLALTPDNSVTVQPTNRMATLSLREKVKRLGKSSEDRTLGNAHGWVRAGGEKLVMEAEKHKQRGRTKYSEKCRRNLTGETWMALVRSSATPGDGFPQVVNY